MDEHGGDCDVSPLNLFGSIVRSGSNLVDLT